MGQSLSSSEKELAPRVWIILMLQCAAILCLSRGILVAAAPQIKPKAAPLAVVVDNRVRRIVGDEQHRAIPFSFCYRFACVSAAATCQSRPGLSAPAQVARRVGFVLSTKTWRHAAPLDITTLLREKLARVGIAIVEPPPADADLVLKVDFAEDKGGEYRIASMYAPGLPICCGTEMRCTVTLTDLQARNVLLKVDMSGATSRIGLVSDLYNDALATFKNGNIFKNIEYLICAAMGDQRCLSTIVPLVLDEKVASDLLDRNQYRPATDTEKAFLAAGRRDFDACITLGPAAVEPLLRFLGHGHRSRTDKTTAVRALGEIGGPLAERGLLRQIPGFYSDEKPVHLTEDRASDLPVVLQALGKIGTRASIPKITPFVTADIRLWHDDGEPVRGRRAAKREHDLSTQIRDAAKKAVSEIERRQPVE